MKKKLLITIIILLIIIFIILTSFFRTNNKKLNNSYNSKNSKVEDVGAKDLEEVTSATAYFTVQSCINKYITYVAHEDKDSIYKLLDNEYIQKNNITEKNVLEKIDKIEKLIAFEADKMYVEKLNEDINKYYVSGILKQQIMDKEPIEKGKFYISVKLDFDNKIFCVEPLKDGGIFDEANN